MFMLQIWNRFFCIYYRYRKPLSCGSVMQRTEKDNKRNTGNGDRAFAALFKMWRIKVMEKWIENSLVTIFLLLNAYWDIRERRVLLWSIRVFGVMGMVLLFFVENEMIFERLCGILPGLFLMACSYATRQAVGYGDGMAVLVCGVYLGLGETFAMLFYALFFCSAVSVFMLVLQKRTYKTGVPFLPYLCAGYICVWILQKGA